MEENTNQQMTKFEHREIDRVGQIVERMVVLIMSVVGLGLVGLVGYGVWLVRVWLPYLGVAALVAALLVVAALAAWPIIWVVRAAKNMGHVDIGEFGTIVNTLFGRVVYAPMTANQARTTRIKNRVKVQQEVPTLMELIESHVISVGQLVMHMGFELSKGGLLPVIDKWPGTFGIAGMGRSGKTRRVIMIIAQAVMGYARVIVCDPHITKLDGLGKLLRPLSRWVTIVEGDDAIVQVSRMFLDEMERRVSDHSGAVHPAWVIVYDEWSRLMHYLSEEDKQVLIAVVRECSTQYAGYNGYSGIIGQTWTEDAVGSTDIRRSLHKVFVHCLNAEYAKFFLKGKWVNKAEDLTTRECLYKEAGQVKQIVTTTIPDEFVEWFADWLEEHLPAESLPGGAVPAALPGQSANAPMIEGPAAVAHSQRTIPETDPKHEIVSLENTADHENWPQKRINTGELVSVTEDTGRMEENEENYTEEEEQAVIQAIIAISARGDKLTRTAIRDEIGWHGRQFSRVVKPVCDKFNVAVKE